MPSDHLLSQPCREPLRVTLARTGTIALVVGAILALRSGGLSYWPLAALLVLWPALGGHCVEIAFLNWLKPRLPAARAAQAAVRIGVWFAAGIILMLAMRLTAAALAGDRPSRWPAWWVGGLGFVGIELAVHLVLRLRGRPSFYDGRG
jgi:hypothetical protein